AHHLVAILCEAGEVSGLERERETVRGTTPCDGSGCTKDPLQTHCAEFNLPSASTSYARHWFRHIDSFSVDIHRSHAKPSPSRAWQLGQPRNPVSLHRPLAHTLPRPNYL